MLLPAVVNVALLEDCAASGMQKLSAQTTVTVFVRVTVWEPGLAHWTDGCSAVDVAGVPPSNVRPNAAFKNLMASSLRFSSPSIATATVASDRKPLVDEPV